MISGNEIRILDLLPHSGDAENDLIKCNIRVVPLASKPRYEALSYVWGSGATLENIDVEGQTVGITANLHAALKRLRLPDQSRPLWIDQLCINQWDTKEKASQVRMMRDIYTNCSCCRIWMGEIQEGIPLADAEQALQFIEYMAAAHTAEDGDSIPEPTCFQSDDTFKGPMTALRSMSYTIDNRKGNPWWARVWTVQEAVLPPHLILMWGPLSMPWERMHEATCTWTGGMPWRAWELTSKPHASFLGDMMAMIIWLEIAKAGWDSPMYMVSRWRFRRATDPRDKIYGLLGLCPPGSLRTVERCDYDLSPVQVFCSLTIDLIVSEEGLLPLVFDPRLEIERATADMPRWAIDVGEISEFNTDWYHLYGYNHYNANGDRFLDVGELQARAEQEPRTLKLTGVHVDTVEWVGDFVYKHNSDLPKADKITAKAIKSWQSFVYKHVKRGTKKSSELYPGGYTLHEAFARLMLGDLIRNGNQEAEDDEAKEVTAEHIDEFYDYVKTKERNHLWITFWGMMKNQRIFVTKSGLIGTGHREVQPGDEVWVFHSGRVPFTIAPRKGGGDDEYDFGSRCYVQGIMQGQVFEEDEAPVERTIRLY